MPIVTKVRDVMNRKLISVDVKASVRDAVNRMIEKDIGSVVVTREGKPVGILTERDVLKKVISTRRGPMDPSLIKAEDVMTTPLITIDAEASLGEASMLMVKNNIRRLLVTEDGNIVGIFTNKDLLKGTLGAFMVLSSV